MHLIFAAFLLIVSIIIGVFQIGAAMIFARTIDEADVKRWARVTAGLLILTIVFAAIAGNQIR